MRRHERLEMASWKGESQRDAGIVQLSATESFKAVRLIAEKEPI
jgi:hypothetical protein